MRALKPWVPLLGLWALTAAAELAPGRAYYEADPSRVGVEVLGEGPLPYSSRYAPAPSGAVLIENATVLLGDGTHFVNGDVLFDAGRIVAVGRDLAAPAEASVVDGTGRWVTPGIIDVHSHLGDYPSPGVEAHSDGNEATAPVTARVWAEHSVWPQDPQFPLALMGGVTTLQILPGSANLVGGRGVTLKNVPARSVMDMKFPDAPHSLKMACGENPKRVYGRRRSAPSTRMGNVAGYRESWIKARAYQAKLDAAAESGEDLPERDLEMETLAGVLRGEILIHNHCYRADEMLIMLDIAREFDYKITAFHHATEAYKIADVLAEEGVCGALWADWWGFKMESNDAIEENIALMEQAGACAIVHSDSARDIQRLNQEAAKALMAAQRMGLPYDEALAIRWLTQNAAKALGIADQTGTLAPGLMADVVLWTGNPFSVYSRAERVWIDGHLHYAAGSDGVRPTTDFDLAQTPAGRGEAQQ
ncbi:MAG: amidohydrolase [Pseudomonadales bacterium]|jgi:imidazolonepropionase-like amidohydrolase